MVVSFVFWPVTVTTPLASVATLATYLELAVLLSQPQLLAPGPPDVTTVW